LGLRCHAQTAGASLTAQQPINNVVRVSLQALAAVCGGVQSLHTNSYDEALALPSERAAEVALRTQQVIAFESGATDVADPLGGSYLVEDLTSRLIDAAKGLLERIESEGGAVAAIASGFYERAIQESAYRQQQLIENNQRVVVGVNRFAETNQPPVTIQRLPASLEGEQVERVRAVRARRDSDAVTTALAALRTAAEGSGNLLPAMRNALAIDATVGEVTRTLKDVFGTHQPSASI